MKKRFFLVSTLAGVMAGLTVLVAALCGAGPALAQQAPATEIFGGPGGNAFLDEAPPPGARVIEVHVRSGQYVDSVQLVYMLRDGQTIAGPRHGGEGGELNVLRLDPGEYLTGISGRTGSYIDSIEFQTNRHTSPTFGGNGGDREFQVEVPENAQAIGFTGRSGEYVDAIGLTFVPLRRRFSSGFDDAPQFGETSLSGGPGGAVFVDGDIPAGTRVVAVRIHSGSYIDSIQMIYNLPDGRVLEGDRHGGNGGRGEVFRLAPGEYIVGISGRSGTYVDSLRIRTNMRTSQLFGGNGGNTEYRIDVPDGNQGAGFMGRSGNYLDAIGLTYDRIRGRQDRFRDRNRDRDRDRDRDRGR